MSNSDLNNNKTDVIVSVLSASLETIPVAGSFLAELIENVIPNQRQDRIVTFIKELSEKVNELGITIEELKEKYNDPKYSMFSTNCLRYVANEVYEEKIEYYKNLACDAISNDEKTLIHDERILKILGELDYFEIQYLIFYDASAFLKQDIMDKTLERIGIKFTQPSYIFAMTDEEKDEETFKQITLNNLYYSGLLEREEKYSSKGKFQGYKYKITHLGRLVLKKVGVENGR